MRFWALVRWATRVRRESGETELKSAANCILERIDVVIVIRELYGENREAVFGVDASGCKGVLLRTGAGKVKHLSTKQLWVRGAIQSSGIEVQNVSRPDNVSDILRHSGGVRIEARPPEDGVPYEGKHHDPHPVKDNQCGTGSWSEARCGYLAA